MSFYQGLLEAVKTECPVIYITCCHWSDELLALLDHAILNIMTENQYAIGYEWSETQRLCNFRTKDSTENRELKHLQRCLESVSSELFCRQRCYLVVKDPHLFMSELCLHTLLEDTAKRIVSDDSNHTVVLVIARSPLLSAEQKDTVRYLELRPDDFAEILQQLSPFHYNGNTQETTAESMDNGEADSLAVWSGAQDSEPCKMIKTSRIYDAICDELSIGTKPGVKNKLENNRNRASRKTTLRKNYHYLVEKICRNDFTIFQKNCKNIMAPASEAPIIHMILAASISLDIRDEPVKKWFAGRYELLLEKDYAEIWILYSLLQSRLHDLLMRAEITETSYRQWISFLKMRLNYDSVAAAFYFRNETNTLYQTTRPLLPSLCSDSDTENALVHNADLLSAAEKMAAEVQPLLHTQADYLFFLRCVCSVLNQFAVKQSEEMLESAFRKAQNGEMLHSFRRDSAASESTIIGKDFSWENLFSISISNNAPLAGALANHPVLGESVTQQIKQDSDAWNAKYTLDINNEIVEKPKRRRKNK